MAYPLPLGLPCLKLPEKLLKGFAFCLFLEIPPISLNLLQIKHNSPIEREFESWIIHDIENYFARINKRVAIFAVSPRDEKKFPAYEAIVYDSKVIGLQIKKADLSAPRATQTSPDFTNLKWELRDSGQFSNIKRNDLIYFCLPTFINREYKSVALDHCIFWRPTQTAQPTTYWYENKSVINGNGSVNTEGMRWGTFIEKLLGCQIGRRLAAGLFKREITLSSILEGYEYREEYPLYLLFIEL